MRKKHHIMTCMALIASFSFLSPATAKEIPASDAAAEENIQTDTTAATKETTLADQITLGKNLFESLCSSCHTTTRKNSIVGARGQQGVLERFDEAWLDQWLKSPEGFAKTDVAASNLIKSNRFGLVMPTLPAMQDAQQRAVLIEYLKTLK